MRISDWSSDVCSSDLIGWKLAAVNLSDLAAKGARPLACLMNYALQGDAAWDTAFLAGLAEALQTHGMPLIGGDTVSLPKGAPGVFTLTAIGEAPASGAPARNGAQEGDVPYRSEEHTSELQSLMRISYAVFCLKKKITRNSTDIL